MPLPSSHPPRSRVSARVSAAVLLAVVGGGFIWGLAMFALGRTHPDPAPVSERDAAQATLNAIDQALGRRDWKLAEELLAAARLPPGSAWREALALRQEQSSTGRKAPVPRDFLELSPDGARASTWLAVARDGEGLAVLRSEDAGVHWNEVRRLASPARLLRAPGQPQQVLATQLDRERVGWSSGDGGLTWTSLAWPAPAPPHPEAALICLTGDGRTLLALTGATGEELQLAQADGGWTLLAPGLEVLAMAPLEHEALVLARTRDGARTWRLSSDGGRSFQDAPVELQALSGQGVRDTALGEELTLTFTDGRRARFARKDGAFIACAP